MHIPPISLYFPKEYPYTASDHAYESMPNVKYAVIGLAPYALRYDMSKSRMERRHCIAYYPITKTMHNWEEGEHLASIFQEEAHDSKLYTYSFYTILYKGGLKKQFSRKKTGESNNFSTKNISSLYLIFMKKTVMG